MEPASPPDPSGTVPQLTLPGLLQERWFLWPLALRLAVWLLLAHTYEMAVFQDASWQLVAGEGVYARFGSWLASAGDGYYAAPPLYAYMLWVSGRLALALGGHWWLHQLLIKSWLLVADVAVMGLLLRRFPAAARAYWTLWFVPFAGIAQVQPDLWAGLGVLAAFHLAARGRWMAAGLVLGLAAAVKPVPLVILPFLIIYLVRAAKPAAIAPLGGGLLAGLAAGWLPYVLIFPDIRAIGEAIRFHLERPVAGLTIPSGALLIANAGLAVIELIGVRLPWAEAAYAAMVRAGRLYPIVTAGAFLALLVAAVSGRRWSLPRAFCLPLLVFLAGNKVVHEHYLLQVLPLMIALGIPFRGVAVAFSIYLLAAGSPLRYLPSQYGVPSGIDAWFPPLAGATMSLGLAMVAGGAAVGFGIQILRLMRRLPPAPPQRAS